MGRSRGIGQVYGNSVFISQYFCKPITIKQRVINFYRIHRPPQLPRTKSNLVPGSKTTWPVVLAHPHCVLCLGRPYLPLRSPPSWAGLPSKLHDLWPLEAGGYLGKIFVCMFCTLFLPLSHTACPVWSVSCPGIEPGSPAVEAWSPNNRSSRKFFGFFFLI